MSGENLSKAVTCKDVLLAEEVLSKLQDPPTVFVGGSDNMYQGNNHTILKHSLLFLRYHLFPDRQTRPDIPVFLVTTISGLFYTTLLCNQKN